MLSESRKKKLAMLTKSLANGDIAKASELLRRHGHSGVNRHGKKEDVSAGDVEARADGPVALEKACPGQETVLNEDTAEGGCASGNKRRKTSSKDTGKMPVEHMGETHTGRLPMPRAGGTPATHLRYWTVRKTLGQVDPENLAIATQYAAVLRGARQRVDELEASPALCHAAVAQPEDVLFMDIESCGLYGASVFLIGLMYFRGGELHFEQCLARTYAEEAAILRAFAARLEETGVLVTFNGRAFDMNMIRDRCAFHGVTLDAARLPHLDLLYESRRRWKGRLPNCKLQTLEQHLCGRRRYGDIPGWAIPDAYHQFVDTGDARQLRDILHHNLLDLLTMAQVLTIVLTGEDPS